MNVSVSTPAKREVEKSHPLRSKEKPEFDWKTFNTLNHSNSIMRLIMECEKGRTPNAFQKLTGVHKLDVCEIKTLPNSELFKYRKEFIQRTKSSYHESFKMYCRFAADMIEYHLNK